MRPLREELRFIENRRLTSFTAREWWTILTLGDPAYPRRRRWRYPFLILRHALRHAASWPGQVKCDITRDRYIYVVWPGFRSVRGKIISGQFADVYRRGTGAGYDASVRALAKRSEAVTERVVLP